MATVHANKILTKFMLLLGGHNHYVKVSSDSETVRGMGLWEFSGALRELMLKDKVKAFIFCNHKKFFLNCCQTLYACYMYFSFIK